jgi:hypothetical protein
VIDVLAAASELYVVPPLMAWQQPEPADPKKPPILKPITIKDNLGYDGREVVAMVTLLASVYGWTHMHILHEMTAYEVAIYAQEAMLHDHERRDWQYMLSEVGFKKSGDDYVKQPLSPLPWIKKEFEYDKSTLTPVPERFMPGGDIYGLRMNPDTGKVEQYVLQRAVETPDTPV